MKLFRQGHYKNKGRVLLLDRLIEVNKSKYRWKSPRWDEEKSELHVRLKGVEDDTTYDYELSFSPDDLAALVETALRDRATTSGEFAMAASTVALIKELLLFEDSKPDDQSKPA